MDRFYGATEAVPLESRIRQITEALFGEPIAAYVVLAWDDTRLVGFASYSFLWPAVGLTRSLYLKELYVTETARRTGVGNLLIHSLIEVAAKRRCSRVEWMTEKDNKQAQRFYEEVGVAMNDTKLFYRLENELPEEAIETPVKL